MSKAHNDANPSKPCSPIYPTTSNVLLHIPHAPEAKVDASEVWIVV